MLGIINLFPADYTDFIAYDAHCLSFKHLMLQSNFNIKKALYLAYLFVVEMSWCLSANFR